MYTTHLHTTPDGLRVLVLHREGLHSVDVSLAVQAGPRFEDAATSGLSHLLEHMVFRGTAAYPESRDFHWAVESLGGTLQGSTGRDVSLFNLLVSPRDLGPALELLAEATLRPTFANLELERRLVIEELLQDRDEDDSELNLENLSRALLWPHDSLGLPIVGSRANVERFTRDDVAAFHRRLIRTGNALLTVAGPVAPERAVSLAEAAFADMRPGPPLERKPLRPRRAGPRVRHIEHDGSQVEMMLSFPAPALTDPDAQGVSLLQMILGDGVTSRLQWKVCEVEALAYTVEAGFEPLVDIGVVDVEAAVAPRNLLPLVREVLGALRELKDRGPSANEVERARHRYRLALEFAMDSPPALAGYHTAFLFGGRRTIADRLAELERWTAADLRALAVRLLARRGATLVTVGPARELDRRRIERLLGRF